MIRLGLPKADRQIDVGGGAWVKARPLTTAVMEAAKMAAENAAIALGEEMARVVAAGGTIAGLPAPADPDACLGLGQMLFIQQLGRYAIVAWNLQNADGSPAPVTPANVNEFVRDNPDASARFLAEYLAPLVAVAAEGNASGPAPSGTAATGPTTAAPAAKMNRRARLAARAKRARAARIAKARR